MTEIEQALLTKQIKIHYLDENNAFRTKVLLELEDPENSYLLYAPFPKPEDKDNFLLDILLYCGKYGLRFEIGKELADSFSQRINTEVRVLSMQASLPTYTQLGMASLLPGQITEITNDGTVFVDGISTRGLKNRNKILQSRVPDSIALKLDEFIQLGKEEGMAQIKGKRVVYCFPFARGSLSYGRRLCVTFRGCFWSCNRIVCRGRI